MSYFSTLFFVILIIIGNANSYDCISKERLESILAYEANSLSSDIHVYLSIKNTEKYSMFANIISTANDIFNKDNIYFNLFCLSFKANQNKHAKQKESIDIDSLVIKYKMTNYINIVSNKTIGTYKFKEIDAEDFYNLLSDKYSLIKTNQIFKGKL